MNFFQYMESRYVSSQIALNMKRGTATTNLAVNAATKGHMWLWLKVASVFFFFFFPLHYLLVLLHIAHPPRAAAALAAEANQAQKDEAQRNRELAEKISKDLLKGATGDRADAGLDSLKSGIS